MNADRFTPILALQDHRAIDVEDVSRTGIPPRPGINLRISNDVDVDVQFTCLSRIIVFHPSQLVLWPAPIVCRKVMDS